MSAFHNSSAYADLHHKTTIIVQSKMHHHFSAIIMQN